MPKAPKGPLRRRKTKQEPKNDLKEYLAMLLASIYEETGDNPLNAGQLKIVIKHLEYALVVGWEQQ